MSAGGSRSLPSLRRLLLLSHIGLTLATVSVALLAGGMALRAALLQEGEARVEIAAVEALRRVEDSRRELGVVARLLSERPTLVRLIRQRRTAEAHEFLGTYARSARLDHVRIERGDELLIEIGTPPPQLGLEGLQFDHRGNVTWRVVTRGIDDLPGVRIWLGQKLPLRTLVTARDRPVAVDLWSPERVREPGAEINPHLASLRHVFATGQRELVTALPEYAALRLEPLRSREGEVVAVLSVGLPRSDVNQEIAGWFGLFALGLGTLAVLAALLSTRLSARISRPFAELAIASHRLGVGDLRTALPAAPRQRPLAEADALLRSLDSMRLNLLELSEREQARRRELDAILDGVDEGIIAIDAERRIQYANRRFGEMFPSTGLVGEFCGDVLAPESMDGRRRCEVDCPLLRARQQGTAQSTERCTGGGRLRNLVIHSNAPNGARQVAIVREESPAEASRSMRDAILANLAHEFQTPIAAQVAAIEMLRDHLADSTDPMARALVDSQYRGALRLSQLVENLLDSVRLDSGEMRLRREPVDLPTVVNDALTLMRPLLDQRDQRVIAELPGNERVVVGDPQRLVQIVVNLLANANKFAPDQSRIWLELLWGDRFVSLWVEDEGPGLPAFASKSDLFAPFRRSPSEEPVARGTGLGLAIVRALVEKHGGEIVVASPRHQKGARFGIVLPIAEANDR